jgi:alkaline phosphatase D
MQKASSFVNNRQFTRRQFLQEGARLSAIIAMSSLSGFVFGASRNLNRVAAYPFYLGVASGDPTPDSVILWTRISKEALAGTGAENDPIQVGYEISESPSFSRLVRSGNVVAPAELGHSAHAEIRGLQSGREYFYRWILAGEMSPVGRTKTAARADEAIRNFQFAFASCQQYEHGYYTAYQHMAEEDLDLIVHLGDYIYESSWGDNLVRHHEGPEIISLDDYRRRYETYKSDEHLMSAHAAAPWVVTWDDHEVDNNYAAGIAEDEQTPEQLLRRRAAAYQAYFEFMPIRLPVGRQGPDMPIHRRLRFGNLLDMNVLDTRQYRSDQACGDGRKLSCDAHRDASRTLLGKSQRDWLFNGLETADATWNVLAQQVMMAGLRSPGDGSGELWPMDIWDGYPYERKALLDHLLQSGTPNPVVLTGDIHANWVADLKVDFDNPQSKTVGTEFVGTSITSGGDGADMTDYGRTLLANNPHVKFYNAQRGYVKSSLTPSSWTADYKVVESITEPDAAIKTRVSYVIEAGEPGAQLG